MKWSIKLNPEDEVETMWTLFKTRNTIYPFTSSFSHKRWWVLDNA